MPFPIGPGPHLYFTAPHTTGTVRKRRYKVAPPGEASSNRKKQKTSSSASNTTSVTRHNSPSSRREAPLPRDDEEEVEKVRCRRHGIPYGQQPWNTPEFERNVEAIDADDPTKCQIRSYLKAIGDGQSVLELKKIIQQLRSTHSAYGPFAQDVGIIPRYSRIVRRHSTILYLVLQQWIDVLRMYEDCRDLCSPRNGQFVVNTNTSWNLIDRGRRGNPLNTSESDITNHITSQLFPGLQTNSPEWAQERRTVGKLRKYGRRLAALKSCFREGGEGMLCLALLSRARDGAMSGWEDHV